MDDKTATDMIRLRGHTGPVYGTSFSHDRSLLVSGSEDGTGEYMMMGNSIIRKFLLLKGCLS